MDKSPNARILILTDRPATAKTWAASLEGPGCRIWLARKDLPEGVRPDLILTDRDASEHAAADGASEQQEAGWMDTNWIGVIRVGGRGAADVRLPANAAGWQLRLACRLLAQIVRLRREDLGRARVTRRLAHEALTDPLTGLPNRRAWDEALEGRLAASGGLPGQLCLAVIDLDHFKRINDAHGHAAGDAVLRAVGHVLRDGLREDDFVARLGGDEFGLLLSVSDEATAQLVVDRVRTALPSGLAGVSAHVVTASAGFHVMPSGATPLPSPAPLYRAADDALHEAKRQGRDRTVSR